MLFLNSWRVSSHMHSKVWHYPSNYPKTALTHKRSLDWTSTHWVWVSFWYSNKISHFIWLVNMYTYRIKWIGDLVFLFANSSLLTVLITRYYFTFLKLTSSFSSFTFSLAGVDPPGIRLTLGLGIPRVGSLLLDGGGEASLSVRTVSCDCRTNIPRLSGHVKYCFPWTEKINQFLT
jgi:hypothetical protein